MEAELCGSSQLSAASRLIPRRLLFVKQPSKESAREKQSSYLSRGHSPVARVIWSECLAAGGWRKNHEAKWEVQVDTEQ